MVVAEAVADETPHSLAYAHSFFPVALSRDGLSVITIGRAVTYACRSHALLPRSVLPPGTTCFRTPWRHEPCSPSLGCGSSLILSAHVSRPGPARASHRASLTSKALASVTIAVSSPAPPSTRVGVPFLDPVHAGHARPARSRPTHALGRRRKT